MAYICVLEGHTDAGAMLDAFASTVFERHAKALEANERVSVEGVRAVLASRLSPERIARLASLGASLNFAAARDLCRRPLTLATEAVEGSA